MQENNYEAKEEDFEVDKIYEKQTKHKNSGKYKIITLSIFCLIFLASAITLGVLYSNATMLKNDYQISLDSGYNRAVYDLVDNINDIELNLNKTNVSSAEKLQKKYLQLVCDNCKYAQGNLAQLPANSSVIVDAVKFVNQIDGYCTSLIATSSGLSKEQKMQLAGLADVILELKVVFNSLVDKLLQGYSILEHSEEISSNLDDFSVNFSPLSSDSISYPSMIFDGPFSDSLYNREIVGLPEEIVDENIAKDNLFGILTGNYDYSSVEYIGESNGMIQTYDYKITLTNQKNIFAQVTKRGGFLLCLVGEATQREDVNYTMAQCEQIATNFCLKCGASDMQMVWSEDFRGIAVLNMAPVVNNIIYYPDLIKVKIDMYTGEVVGYEAQNYAINHKERNFSFVSFGATDARNMIDATININQQRLCVIPLEWGGEILAYEFDCEYYGSQYYIYINVDTGSEEKILKVVGTSEGYLLS